MVKNNKAFNKPNKTVAVNVARNTMEYATGANTATSNFTFSDDLKVFTNEEIARLRRLLNVEPEIVEPVVADVGTLPMDANIVRWSGVIAYEGEKNANNDFLNVGSIDLQTRGLPFPISYMNTTNHGDAGQANVVGGIDQVQMIGTELHASGWIDLALGPIAAEAARNLDTQAIKGVSIEWGADNDEIEFETTLTDIGDGMTMEEIKQRNFLRAELLAATFVAIPAWPNAYAKLDMPRTLAASLTASGVYAPPKEFFLDPMLTEATRVTVTDQGHIFGHIATWDTCHIGIGNKCVKPPRPTNEEQASYREFHRDNPVICDDGTVVSAGVLTMSTGHANKLATLQAAEDHYDHTGAACADVAIGADEIGIWVAGSVRPWLTDEQKFEMMRANWSGDWRSDSGRLELIALLAVNVPGFPVYSKREVNGRVLSESLVASARFCDDTEVEVISPTEDTPDPMIILAARIDSMLACIDRLSTFLDQKEIEELDEIMHMQA